MQTSTAVYFDNKKSGNTAYEHSDRTTHKQRKGAKQIQQYSYSDNGNICTQTTDYTFKCVTKRIKRVQQSTSRYRQK